MNSFINSTLIVTVSATAISCSTLNNLSNRLAQTPAVSEQPLTAQAQQTAQQQGQQIIQGQTTPTITPQAPVTKPAAPATYPIAKPLLDEAGQPVKNRFISPYKPYNVIDTTGFKSGQLAGDPSTIQYDHATGKHILSTVKKFRLP